MLRFALMSPGRPCPKCGAPAREGTKFCGQCGHDVARVFQTVFDGGAFIPPGGLAPGPAPAAGPPGEPPAEAATPTPVVPAPFEPVGPTPVVPAPVEPVGPTPVVPAPAPVPAPGTAVDKRTMLGLPMVDRDQVLAAAQAAGVQVPPDAMIAPAEAPSPEAAPAPTPPSPTASATASRPENRTMLGMTAPQLGQPPPVAPAAPAPVDTTPMATEDTRPAARLPEGPPGTPHVPPSRSHRTMLGVMAPPMEGPMPSVPEPVAADGAGPPGAPAGPTNRTMLGVAPPVARDAAAPSSSEQRGSYRPRMEVQYPDGRHSSPDLSSYRPPRRKSPWPLLIGVGLLGVFVVAGGLAAILLLTGGGPELEVSVVSTEAGERLRVRVPEAAPGTQVRFSGHEAALEAEQASFEIAADSLQIGDNELTFEVVAPNGEVEPGNVTLTLSYRVRADLDSLAEDPPAVRIIAQALPGSSVTLDGSPLELDAEGLGARPYPVQPSAEGVFEHAASYRVELPDGEAHEGTVRTRVPLASLQLDRQGERVVTDQAEIEIAGAVHPGAEVRIDGVVMAVNEGRFLHRYALPQAGTFRPVIVARRPGRAPHAMTLEIRRVEDLAAEAASFQPDPGMSYARIAQNPSIYQGQRIALEGRIYNVDVQGGRSTIQILARDCARGQRCPVWVTHPAATDLTVNTWVRVLGTVEGEQQFRSESGEVRTVPRVEAVYLLPVER